MSSLAYWIKNHYDLTTKDKIHDAEVDSWFLMDNPTPVVTIVALYLLFVLKAGPQMMENRKPFALKSFLLFYNLAIAIFNGYMFSTFLLVFNYPLKYLCTPHPNKNALPLTRILYETSWYYLLSKIIELSETVFFVLRKKQSQISTLHVYHHTCMVINTWLYLKYLKTEHGIVVGLLNTFVHVVMYLYYFLAALGPNVQKYLWWKKYITVIQLVQFALILTFGAVLLIMNCKVHRALSTYMMMHTILFVVMFSNFYRKAYIKGKSSLRAANLKNAPLKCE